jgi:ribosomal protein S27AE
MDEVLEIARGGGLEPDVRGAGLMHAARVCTVLDRAEANQIFDEGVATLAPLTSGFDQRYQRWYAERVVLIGSVVRPERVHALVPVGGLPGPTPVRFARSSDGGSWPCGRCGLLSGASESRGYRYPYHGAREILGLFTEDLFLQQSVLQGAYLAWQASPDPAFYRLLASHWSVLPTDELTDVLQAVLDWVHSQPEQAIQAQVCSEITFSQEKDLRLFELLPVLRRFAQTAADALIAARPDLKRAAERFPLGIESMLDEFQRQRPAVQAGSAGIGFGGQMTGEQGDDIDSILDVAMRLYEVDTDQDAQNQACSECWPSTQMFRRAFHAAGVQLKESGFTLLPRVPNPAMAFFSRIALLGALAGLPELRLAQAFVRRDDPGHGSRSLR